MDIYLGGYMERLDNKWILSSEEDNICNEKDSNSPATLGLENMMGVFILVGAGIVGGIGLILLEIIYHKHKMRKVDRSEAAKVAISRWKGTVEVSLAKFYSNNFAVAFGGRKLSLRNAFRPSLDLVPIFL